MPKAQIHENCKSEPKGTLHKLSYTATGRNGGLTGFTTPYYICESCKIVIKLQQAELSVEDLE
jgi:hypothetical protein